MVAEHYASSGNTETHGQRHGFRNKPTLIESVQRYGEAGHTSVLARTPGLLRGFRLGPGGVQKQVRAGLGLSGRLAGRCGVCRAEARACISLCVHVCVYRYILGYNVHIRSAEALSAIWGKGSGRRHLKSPKAPGRQDQKGHNSVC